MARRTFFSFHHERDNWRVSQVRNSWVAKPDRESAGFWDAAEWEAVRLKTELEITKWIDRQLEGTSVTVVLIGAETANRKYVQYELRRSMVRGNGVLGIRIHNIKDVNGMTDVAGVNPLPKEFPIYDWVLDHGRDNIGEWIEKAAKAALR